MKKLKILQITIIVLLIVFAFFFFKDVDYTKEYVVDNVNIIENFDKKIKGFASDDALIVAPETRTSSPIRLIRNENLQSNISGIYPCGEGSGYAGGITTSAMDGIKVAEEIAKIYSNVL